MAFVVAVVLIAATVYLSLGFSPVTLVIVGVPGILAYVLWYVTYLRKPLDASVILPSFLLTVAGFAFNAVEEDVGHYGPAIGRLFGFAWTDQAFVLIILILVGVLGLVSVGLYYRVPMAGFVAIVFLATRIAEIFVFVFPLWRPAIQPDAGGPVSQVISGTLAQDMPNYYVKAVGSYYFPGMFTAVLTIVPAIHTLYRIWACRASRHSLPATHGDVSDSVASGSPSSGS